MVWTSLLSLLLSLIPWGSDPTPTCLGLVPGGQPPEFRQALDLFRAGR
jgi:hypothetical protein